MSDRDRGRLVYSTGLGSICPGCGGKTVTVVDGLPNNAAFLKDLCSELKRACGTGGAVDAGTVELQGDLRDRVREFLLKKGYVVKG